MVFGDSLSSVSQGNTPSPGGNGTAANSAGVLHQKMLRQRQRLVDRQRDLSRNRFSGNVAQANHQLPATAVERVNSWGRLLGGEEGHITNGAEKGGSNRLRGAGASVLGASCAATATSDGNAVRGASRSSAEGRASETMTSFDRMAFRSGSTLGGSVSGQASKDLGDGVAVMELVDERSSPRASKRTASDSGSPSANIAWGGNARLQRATQGVAKDVVMEGISEFRAAEEDALSNSGRAGLCGGRSRQGSRRASRSDTDSGGDSARRGQSHANSWDLEIVEEVVEDVPIADNECNQQQPKKWWKPWGRGQQIEAVSFDVALDQSFGPGDNGSTEVCRFSSD
eukprot:TRINITY_DN69466_c0_g1_i1.p1 TRINITY_DN69466_c0_g1~~TRINITY_DN69466_c0_g1_i1.p1  ORF type:complete len:341 (+),score=65.57 TRINITY_DN69466_c0_g1_i1:133-1155(+)